MPSLKHGLGLPHRDRVSHSTTLPPARGGTVFRQVLQPMNTGGRLFLRTSEYGGCLSRVTSISSEQLSPPPSLDWNPNSLSCSSDASSPYWGLKSDRGSSPKQATLRIPVEPGAWGMSVGREPLGLSREQHGTGLKDQSWKADEWRPSPT